MYDKTSNVEKIFLKESGYKDIYSPTEKVKSIIVNNFPTLGKLTSLRFLEWVQKNPEGVVSLPTGKTPEYFIKYSNHFLKNWDNKEIAREIENYELDINKKPDLSKLRFVQIDEFYPFPPSFANSFNYYIKKFYIGEFGFNEKNALLIDAYTTGIPKGYKAEDIFENYYVDIMLRTRSPKSRLESIQKDVISKVDEYCMRYEEKIQKLGGIGFFLGGIGPDGHIGFNILGSDFNSTTRLLRINYETAAAAAGDLGGIEASRDRLVITIGLKTITYRDDVVPLIIASGRAKSEVIANTIEKNASIKYPGSTLHNVEGARYYLTQGAAYSLIERNYKQLSDRKTVNNNDITEYVVNHCINNNIAISEISDESVKNDRFLDILVKKSKKDIKTIKEYVEKRLVSNIENGIKKTTNEVILHTSPHHDDEILGYSARILHSIREVSNTHHFAYLTSGFTSVTNKYVLELYENLFKYIKTIEFPELIKSEYFSKTDNTHRNNDLYYFLDGLAADDLEMQEDATSRRLFRILIEVFKSTNVDTILDKIKSGIKYLRTTPAGTKDTPEFQTIKGMIREWEAELVWGHFGFNSNSVHHLRLGFYTGDIFTKTPTYEQDVIPVLDMFRKLKPTIITVALDPEGSGPDTHYKVLQVISKALKIYKEETDKEIKVWGYRNVWYKFHPSETRTYIPTTLNTLAIQHNIFMSCFGSQKNASFPSYAYDGPFSKLAHKIIVNQYKQIKTCLGENFFYEHKHPKFRGARGFIFLKEMTLKEFYKHAEDLKSLLE